MDWNQIKHKALQSLNHAAQETEKMARISQERRTQQQILNTQRSLWTQMGELLYRQYQTDSTQTALPLSDDVLAFCHQLQHLDEELAAIDSRIHDLQMTPAPTTAPNPATEAPTSKACTTCQQTIPAGARFCPHCGAAQP